MSTLTIIPLISKPSPSENNAESFCQNTLGISFEEARKLWNYDPEKLIFKAVHLKGLPRKSILDAVKKLFPFEGDQPPLSVGFYHSLAVMFPFHLFFHPCDKFNIAKFKESQALLREIALHFMNLTHDPDQFITSLEEQQLCARSDLGLPHKKALYALLKTHFSTFKDPISDIEPVKQKLKQCCLSGIYTLKNAIIAVTEPQLLRSTKKSTLTDEEFQALGNSYILESIRSHIQFQTMSVEESHFGPNLEALCKNLTPFLTYVAVALHQNETDFHLVGTTNVLSQLVLDKLHMVAPISCTLLSAILQYMGHQVEILTRMDLNVKLSPTIAHAIVVVTNKATQQKIIIDPAHTLFLSDLYGDDPCIPEILVCPEDKIEEKIQEYAQFRRNKVPKTETPLFKASKEEFLHYFRSLWCLQGYVPVTQNFLAESLFTKNPQGRFLLPQHRHIKEMIKRIGLEGQLVCQSFEEKMENVRKRSATLNKIELLHELRAIPNEYDQFFIEKLGLDPRLVDKLFNLRTVGYLMALREHVNPHHKQNTTTVYGCSGSDLSSLLLALNSTHMVFIDRTPINCALLQSFSNSASLPPNVAEEFKNYKFMKYNFGGSKADSAMPKMELKILFELTLLGVDTNTIQLRHKNGEVTLSFMWSYQGQPPRQYHATWICAHLDKPETYPETLKTLIKEQKIDFYYQKAANVAPKDYDKYLATLASGIRKGGFMLTSNYDMKGNYYSPEPFLNGNFTTNAPSPFMEAYAKLNQGILAPGWLSDVPCQREESYSPPLDKYWVHTEIRKKQ